MTPEVVGGRAAAAAAAAATTGVAAVAAIEGSEGIAPECIASVRGWRSTLGNLIEFLWLKKPVTGLNFLVYA